MKVSETTRVIFSGQVVLDTGKIVKLVAKLNISVCDTLICGYSLPFPLFSPILPGIFSLMLGKMSQQYFFQHL